MLKIGCAASWKVKECIICNVVWFTLSLFRLFLILFMVPINNSAANWWNLGCTFECTSDRHKWQQRLYDEAVGHINKHSVPFEFRFLLLYSYSCRQSSVHSHRNLLIFLCLFQSMMDQAILSYRIKLKTCSEWFELRSSDLQLWKWSSIFWIFC